MKRLNIYSSYATKLLVVTILAVGTVGCSDFLELQPPA